ncbi:nitric oxide reductase transcription regulator NorR2 [Peptococcaceae bacterium CEB3]|nr:nitric oxide reductase transcription regulator NorR2 [Peptococcaceae bacterium CEB3]
MESRIKALLMAEESKSPLTDEEVAQRVGLRRDQVTLIRQRLGIPESRERLRQALIKTVTRLESLAPEPMSDRELARRCRQEGFKVSRQLVSRCRCAKVKLPAGGSDNPRHVSPFKVTASSATVYSVPKLTSLASANPFSRLVGFSGSLKSVIEQAQAAVLYPPYGLHTLILGPTGVGKSELAKAMFEFAQANGRISMQGRFILFNCADYRENPQLLVSQLFGVAKGAYTGANSDRAGLVEQADGGMLFLDEVHCLPANGQEILYQLLDHGTFHRLGESNLPRKAQVIIVAATTEDIDSSLLLPFRRRIPMVIHVPSLKQRLLGERMEFLHKSFAKEAARTGMPIEVTGDALRAFLLYESPGNLGGLMGDVQVTCARAFVSSVTRGQGVMSIGIHSLPAHVASGLMRTSEKRRELEELIQGDLKIDPGEQPVKPLVKATYVMPNEIYEYIESRYGELLAEGLTQESIYEVLYEDLEERLNAFIRRLKVGTDEEPQGLATVVDGQFVRAATAMVAVAKDHFGAVDERLLYCLAMHLAATIDRIKEGRCLPGLQLPLQEYRRELESAKKMVAVAEIELGLDLPPEEIDYVAFYLRSIHRGTENAQPRVGVVVLSHGRVAGAMVEVANRLLGINHSRAVEMTLDEPPEAALVRARQAVLDSDEGRGVLILADMGSLVSFGPLITEATGIATRVIERTDTVAVIDAVRRAMLPGASLDEIVIGLPGVKPLAPLAKHSAPKAVLAVCISGEGTALRIKDFIQKEIPDLLVLTEGLVSHGGLGQLSERYDLAAVVGTVDPGLPGVPFVPFQEVLSGPGMIRLRVLTGNTQSSKPLRLKNILNPDLLLPQVFSKNKENVLQSLADLMISHGYASAGYLESVMEREAFGLAVFSSRFAVPHASDPTLVRRSGVALAVLKEPLSWGEGLTIDVVCMLALTVSDAEIVYELSDLANRPERLEKLYTAKSREEMFQVLSR